MASDTELVDQIEEQSCRLNEEDSCQCGSPQCREVILSRELDAILNPKVIFHSQAQLDRIWPLLTNRRMDVASYLALLSEYRIEQHCGYVWPPNNVAYRCRTCSEALAMSLCTDCFRNGNHEGHDYNMFKSRSGGACDCGYSIVKESGHCKNHGKNAVAKRSGEEIPNEIICIVKRAMPRLVHRLAIQHRRSHVIVTNGETEMYLDFLIHMASSSAVLRGLMIDALISEEVYSSQINLLSNHPDKDVARTVNEGLKKLKREGKTLNPRKLIEDWDPSPKEVGAFCDSRSPKRFVDELVFWVVVFEFPQKLVCFLLSFMMNETYKSVFARAFVGHYARIMTILAGIKGEPRRHLRDSYEQLSFRILRVTSQLVNDADLTRMLCEEEQFLHTIIYCLKVAIEGAPSESLRGVLKVNPLCSNSNNPPRVVCCDNLIMRDRHLGSFTDDLNSVLYYENEAKRLVNDKDLLNTWIEMLSYFQTMNPYKRELTEHTPYETGPHNSVFMIDADFCLTPLWSILSHLRKKSDLPLSRSLLESIHVNLAKWFHRMSIGPNSLLDPYHMSFHIPLHRMFAATVRHMLFIQNDPDCLEFISQNQSIFGGEYCYKSACGAQMALKIDDFLKMLMMHPLQALTLYHEIRSSMWTRNGLMTINQAIAYVCYSTVDLDLFLLKFCASRLNPNYFLRILMSRFHSWKWLSFKSNTFMINAAEDIRRLYHFNILPEQMTQMVESSLLTLIQLLTLNIHCNISESEQIKQEMIAMIAIQDRSYSYLIEMISERSVAEHHNIDENFKSLLDELTIYKPAQHGIGGNLQQGCYTLKPEVWDKEFNPIYVQCRFYQKRDYQMALERFFHQSRTSGGLERRPHPSTLWPPLKIPRNIANFGQIDLSLLLQCPTIVGLVFSIIYKNLYIFDVSETIVAYAIHLLELALRKWLDQSDYTGNVQGGDQKRPEMNESFTGTFSYRELSSCPAYFGSKGEAHIKGSTIYASFDKHDKESYDHSNLNLFPVVRHALDLGFDTTWFPFKSVIENCSVHVENVHSLSLKEFEVLLKCPSQGEEPYKSESNQSDGCANCDLNTTDMWCVQGEVAFDDGDIDDDDDEGTGIDDEDDNDDEEDEDDEEEEDEDEENDESGGRSDARDHDRDFNTLAHTGIMPPLDPTWPVDGIMRTRRSLGTTSPATVDEVGWRADHHTRTHDRSTNTQSHWALGIEHQQIADSQNLSPTTNVGTIIHSGLASQATHSSAMALDPTTTEQSRQNHETPFNVISAEIHPESNEGEPQVTTDEQQGLSHLNTQLLIQDQNLAATEPVTVEHYIDDVEMITVTYERNPSDDQLISSEGQAPAQPSAGDNSDDSLDFVGERNPLLSGPTTTPSTSNQASLIRAVNDHTYSVTETSMEVEIMPETQNSALSLVPVNQTRAGNTSQLYPENLVTERRAILASDPRPMIAGPAQPLALQTASNLSLENNVGRHENCSRSERSLSEVDIQARFMGFFQSRLDPQRPGPRGFRQRQMARRGGYRGPVHQFAVHNPNNTQQATSGPVYPWLMHEILPRQSARRSSACTLLNRVLLSRSQRARRCRRLRKDRMYHGESLLSLLLRLHAKYSQQARSYEYNERRARAERGRIGDGVHFVTIVLDLICTLDQRMKFRVERLQELIWGDKDDLEVRLEQKQQHGAEASDVGLDKASNPSQSTGMNQFRAEDQASVPCTSSSVQQRADWEPSGGSSAAASVDCTGAKVTPTAAIPKPLTPTERRRRAKEFQCKLMAQFANKQRAFIEKYESSSQQTAHCKAGSDKVGASNPIDEEPINLSSKLSQKSKSQMSDCDKQQEQQSTPKVDKNFIENQELGGGGHCCRSGLASGLERAPSASGLDPDRDGSARYECCICGVEGPSDLTNPLGQVVLLQSTSIYGHSHLRPSEERRLPCEQATYQSLKEETYAKYLEARIDLLCEHFSESSWLDSINIGAEGGVHVQSCGHYLHIECYQSYIKSLDQEDRLRSRADSDEFLCPVCRQLANSVLPILSDLGRPGQLSLALVSSGQLDDQIGLIGSLLQRRLAPNQRELQSSASFCSHLTKATGPQYRLVRSNASMHSLFLFLTSIARTNLETEVIVRSSRAKASASKRSCFKLLFQVLALNAQTLINDQWFTYDQIWSHLTHRVDERHRLSVKPLNSEVPLLLRDSTAMLLQFLFAISNSLCYRENFTCLVQILFNLTVIQSIALVLSYVKPTFLSDCRRAERGEQLTSAPKAGREETSKLDQDLPATQAPIGAPTNDFLALVSSVGQNLGQMLAPNIEEPLVSSVVRSSWSRFEPRPSKEREQQRQQLGVGEQLALIENRVKLACLPYLRAAALLRHHLYEQQPYPDLSITDDERLSEAQYIEADFAALAAYLQLGTRISNATSGATQLTETLNWPRASERVDMKLIASWSCELLRFGAEFSIAARSLLLCRSLAWYRPSLMQLPRSFDDIFMFYYRKKCSLCQQIPKDVAICLVCGAPICFRVSCCKDRSRSRQVHSQHCGANTAVFLAVHTSSVVVIRGNRACVWGSVYLDAHDEEDNGLQRGKPLYLVPERFELLKEQWLTHSFDHTCGKRWIYLQENQ